MKVYLRGSVSRHLVKLLGQSARRDCGTANLSGIWKLNLADSDFGEQRAPRGIDAAIEHREPFLRYFGIFVDQNGRSSSFDMETRADGKPRAVNGATVAARRIDPYTTATEWRSLDGEHTETTVMRLAPDRRTLVIDRRASGPDGEFSSCEVYEKHRTLSLAPDRKESPSWNLRRPISAFNGAAAAILKSLLAPTSSE